MIKEPLSQIIFVRVYKVKNIVGIRQKNCTLVVEQQFRIKRHVIQAKNVIMLAIPGEDEPGNCHWGYFSWNDANEWCLKMGGRLLSKE